MCPDNRSNENTVDHRMIISNRDALEKFKGIVEWIKYNLKGRVPTLKDDADVFYTVFPLLSTNPMKRPKPTLC